MKARWTKWGPIVYSAVDADGDIIRIALRPVLDSEPMGEGPRFPCRVAWDCPDSSGERWAASCRCDAAPLARLSIGPDGLASGWFAGVDSEGEDVMGNAIAWLIAGERAAIAKAKGGAG